MYYLGLANHDCLFDVPTFLLGNIHDIVYLKPRLNFLIYQGYPRYTSVRLPISPSRTNRRIASLSLPLSLSVCVCCPASMWSHQSQFIKYRLTHEDDTHWLTAFWQFHLPCNYPRLVLLIPTNTVQTSSVKVGATTRSYCLPLCFPVLHLVERTSSRPAGADLEEAPVASLVQSPSVSRRRRPSGVTQAQSSATLHVLQPLSVRDHASHMHPARTADFPNG